MTPSPPPPSDRFERLRLLGEGASGVVHEARDRYTGARVAVKTLRRLDPVALLAFKAEFRTLSRLHHPNVVRLHGLFEEHGAWCFAMDLVEGRPFVQHVRHETPAPAATAPRSTLDSAQTLPRPADPDATLEPSSPITGEDPPIEAEASPLSPERLPALREALGQLVDAVSAVHAFGLVHRDLKSANALVTDAGRVVLLDFGLAVEAGAEAGVAGTATTMAPEQAAGDPATEASDWYAVGVMLYAALAGRPPFVGPAARLLSDKQRLDAPPLSPVPGAEDLSALAMALLARDPVARPDGVALRRALGRPTPTATREPALVGRADALATLARSWQVAQAGTSALVRIEGPSGVGKTALIRRFLRDRGDALVLSGACAEHESVPFNALDPIVDQLARTLADWPPAARAAVLPRRPADLTRLFPVTATLLARPPDGEATPDAQARGAAALRELLERVSERQPLLIVIDDAHWGDRDSAGLLDALLAGTHPPRALWITSLWPRAASPRPMEETLDTLATRLDAAHVDLGPLGEADALRLAEAVLGPGAEALARQATREAGGDPLLLVELSRAAESQGAVTGLEALVRGRLDALPAPARAVVEAAAVAGGPLRAGALLAAAQVTDWRVVAGLRGEGLLKGRGLHPDDPLDLPHRRLREAVFIGLSDDRRRALRRALADALAGEAPERRLRHLLAADDRPAALACALQVAEAADAQMAFDRAAETWGLAVSLTEAGDPARPGRLRSWGEALARAHRGAEAAAALQEAAALAEPAEGFALRRSACEQLLHSGRSAEGFALLDQLLQELGVRPWQRGRRLGMIGRIALGHLLCRWGRPHSLSARERARFEVLYTGALGATFTDPALAGALGSAAMLIGVRGQDPGPRSAALALLSLGLPGTLRGIRRAARLLDEARTLAGDDEVARGRVDLFAALAALRAGRRQDVEALVEQAVTALRRSVGWDAALAELARSALAVLNGRFEDLERDLPERLALARSRGNRVLEGLLEVAIGVPVALALDRPEAAEARLARSRARWGDTRWGLLSFRQLLAEAQIACYRGDAAALHARLSVRWPALIAQTSGLNLIGPSMWWARGAVAVVALRQGDASAAAIARSAARRLRRRPWVVARAWGQFLTQSLRHAEGDPGGAAEGLRRLEATLPVQIVGPTRAAIRLRRAAWEGDDDEVRATIEATRGRYGIVRPRRWARWVVP
ncbi:MAG: AAA family ATPase [Alphaproteobacteria bacterium]|nr:AAA family ATPase [Alphaproteobacteria bacterium]